MAATVDIYVSDYNGNTVIMLYSHNFGIGSKECESKLGYVKNTIEEELQKFEKKQVESHESKFETINKNLDALIKLKQLLDMGAISQEEFDLKKRELL